ncbi:MAG: 2-phospho-L-lactate guanylyltransferase [Dehalococcoidia bacterium]
MNEHGGLTAVIPMKPLIDGKSRLAGVFTDEQRGDLVIGMLTTVIDAIKGAGVDSFIIVGGDERVAKVGEETGGKWIQDPGTDLNDTLKTVFAQILNSGQSALFLAGDLPFLKSADVYSLIRTSGNQKNIALAPAKKDGGTNGILVPPGIEFEPQMGQRSFAKHLAQAAAAEKSVAIETSDGLGCDLDTTDDLNAYVYMEPGLLERLYQQAAPY